MGVPSHSWGESQIFGVTTLWWSPQCQLGGALVMPGFGKGGIPSCCRGYLGRVLGSPEFWGPTDGNVVEPRMAASFVPEHKAPMVLFLDRVYGVQSQEFLLHVLEVGFLPDMRAAASLDTVRGTPKPPQGSPKLPTGVPLSRQKGHPCSLLWGGFGILQIFPVGWVWDPPNIPCGISLGSPKYSLWDGSGVPPTFPVLMHWGSPKSLLWDGFGVTSTFPL